ncbi:fibronectin type III domain-containing protein [Vandammella animalimorsus]|nr:fibronectin type III domain-containing protein [Vandammella animalimorsus]
MDHGLVGGTASDGPNTLSLDNANAGEVNAAWPLDAAKPFTVTITTANWQTGELGHITRTTVSSCAVGGAIQSNDTTPAPAGAMLPTAPKNVAATPGDGQVSLSWDAPDSPGSSPITGYYVTYRVDGDPPPDLSAPGCAPTSATSPTSCTISGLSNGTQYNFVVRAANALGKGRAPSYFVQATPNPTAGPYAINAVASPAAGGSFSCTPSTAPHGGGSSCTASANPGYVLGSLDGCDSFDLAAGSCQLDNVTGVRTVTAHFRALHAITTVASPPTGGGIGCTPKPVPDRGTSTCTVSVNAGFVLASISGCTSVTGNTCTLNNVQAPVTVTANFRNDRHLVSTAVNPAGSGTVTCTPSTVPDGGSSSCTATANSGYTFVDFSGDCSGTSCNLTNVTGPKSVTANFRKATATATASVTGGHGTVTPPSRTVNVGDAATFTLAPDAGYVPSASVGGNCGAGSFNGNDYTVTNVSADCTLEFRFQATAPGTHAITATASPAAGGTVSCSPSPVPNGGNATCTATPAAGYAFDGFGGDCTSTSGNTCTLTNVTGPKAVTARFRLIGAPPSSSATPVPTLGHWALMLLSLLAAALGLQRLRRS